MLPPPAITSLYHQVVLNIHFKSLCSFWITSCIQVKHAERKDASNSSFSCYFFLRKRKQTLHDTDKQTLYAQWDGCSIGPQGFWQTKGNAN